jgi:hypothetical protein
MRTEVHVHGTLNFLKGVTQSQVESGLRKWLEYLDVETLSEASSLEPDEPGIVFHRSDRMLELCWTGEVGKNFTKRLQEVLLELGPLTESASHIELSYYQEDGRDEQLMLFVGPSAEAIHQAQRRHMIEDVAALLSRHFKQEDVAQVTGLVNVLFDRDLENRRNDKPEGDKPDTLSQGASLLPFRKKHLH